MCRYVDLIDLHWQFIISFIIEMKHQTGYFIFINTNTQIALCVKIVISLVFNCIEQTALFYHVNFACMYSSYKQAVVQPFPHKSVRQKDYIFLPMTFGPPKNVIQIKNHGKSYASPKKCNPINIQVGLSLKFILN